MVSHPELGSDPPIGSDRESGCDRGHGHRTDDCIQLRKEIEYLIRRGHLSRYVAS